jgi:hypothetical protein
MAFLVVLAIITGDVNAQQPASPTTLWSFLGIPQAFRRTRDGLSNRRGNHPGLERRSPVKGLADPANLESDVPSVKKAAEIKQAEDMKKQKIKAVKYLASIGCGCYDKDGEVSGALAASMDDCTEDVRLATVQAIRDAAEGQPCEQCGQSCCCKEVVVLQLARLAYERDDKGCWVEPSERVRQLAAETLRICCPNRGPIEEIPPEEGAVQPPVDVIDEVDDPVTPLPPPEIDDTGMSLAPHHVTPANPISGFAGHSSHRHRSTEVVVTDGSEGESSRPRPSSSRLGQRPYGAVVWVDIQGGVAHVHLADAAAKLPLGAKLRAYRQGANTGLRPLADLEVVKSIAGGANVRLSGEANVSRLQRGDIVTMEAGRIDSKFEAGSVKNTRVDAAQNDQLTFVERIWK